MKILHFILLLFYTLCSTLSAQENSLPPPLSFQISDHNKIQELPPIEWILKQDEQQLNLLSLGSGSIEGAKITHVQDDGFFELKRHHPYWVKINLYNKSEINDWILFIDQKNEKGAQVVTFEMIEAYFVNNGEIISQELSGYKIPNSERSVKNIFSKSLLHLNLDTSTNTVIWLKLLTAEEDRTNINIKLLSNSYDLLTLIKAPNQPITMLQYGSLITLFFIVVFLFIWFRERVYVWFLTLLLISFAAIIFDNYQDKIISVSIPENPWTIPYIIAFLGGFPLLILLQFSRIFIDTKNNFPKIDKFLFGIICYALIGLTMSALSYDFSNIAIKIWEQLFSVLNPILVLSVIAIFIYFIFSKNKLARFFSIGAVTPFATFILWDIGRSLNLYTFSYDPSFLITFGLLITMTLALTYRFKLMNMQRELAQQEKTEQLQRINTASAKFVPSTFLKFLGKKNILDATLGDYVEKRVTVLFSDIRDYTSLSEKMTPEENFKFVNAFNMRMGPIIQKHNGFVNQYLGDGIMAIFPEKMDGTLMAAIEMQKELNNYNQSRIEKKKVPLRMGIGLHTGPLIMGIIGDEQRMDAATISDTVNSASRIESLSKYYGTSILLSEVSLKKIDNREEFHFRYLGKVQVKGKQKPLKIYECFDGDLPEIVELKMATLNNFDAGVKHYFSQLFSEAIMNFEDVIKYNPNDKTAKLFLYKAKQLEKMGVAENWTGVELMGQK